MERTVGDSATMEGQLEEQLGEQLEEESEEELEEHLKEQLKPAFARAQLAIYDGAKATGQPLPASFTARFQLNGHKRSLGTFLHDEPTYDEDMMLDYVRRLRRYEKWNAKRQSSTYMGELRLLLPQNREKLFLVWRREIETRLQCLNLWVSKAQLELDVADSVKEIGQSTALPRRGTC